MNSFYKKYNSDDILKIKNFNSLEKRQKVSKDLMDKYPTRIPIIISFQSSSKFHLIKHKYMVSSESSIGEFLIIIRDYIKNNDSKTEGPETISSQTGFYIFTESNTLAMISDTITNVYLKYKNIDGFLYFIISDENTFGN